MGGRRGAGGERRGSYEYAYMNTPHEPLNLKLFVNTQKKPKVVAQSCLSCS